MSSTTKEPNVAGSFYPADPQELKLLLDHYLSEAVTTQDEITAKALVAPHAGFIYSGPIAASAYQAAKRIKDKISRIILLSPTHHFHLQGAVAPDFNLYKTPLGTIEIDQETIAQLNSNNLVKISSDYFEREHAIEVHIPFIQTIFSANTPIVPIIVGNSEVEQISSIFSLLDNDSTLFIVSGDLSHFLPYDEAKKVDRTTADNLECLNYRPLTGEHSCGVWPIRGMLGWAKQNKSKLSTIDLRNSGDTAGDKDRVVGYGAFVVYKA